jgi:hypothetical protein
MASASRSVSRSVSRSASGSASGLPAEFNFLLNEDMNYDYLTIENRKKLIGLILTNLTNDDKIKKQGKIAIYRDMNFKRKFTNELLQFIADIIIEHKNAGKDKDHYKWIYSNIISIFRIIAFRDQYETLPNHYHEPRNNLYFLFIANLYCNFKVYLDKTYHGIRGSIFIPDFLFGLDEGNVTGVFYITEAQYAALFKRPDGKYNCDDPIKNSINIEFKNGMDMYALSNSSLNQGATEYIENNQQLQRMTMASSRKTVHKKPYDRPSNGGKRSIKTRRKKRTYKKRNQTYKKKMR